MSNQGDAARAIVELLRSYDLSIMRAKLACDRAKVLLEMEPLAKREMTAQCECAAAVGED